jgi:hypothetical protein
MHHQPLRWRNTMWKGLIVLAGAFVLATATSSSVTAQACTVRCECVSAGCGCITSGGNGCKCNASGGGCFVCACGAQCCEETEETTVLGFAPDGSPVRGRPQSLVVRLSSTAPFLLASAQPSFAKAMPTGWEWVGKGHAVRRNCEGIVVKRAYSSSTMDAVRASTKQVSL